VNHGIFTRADWRLQINPIEENVSSIASVKRFSGDVRALLGGYYGALVLGDQFPRLNQTLTRRSRFTNGSDTLRAHGSPLRSHFLKLNFHLPYNFIGSFHAVLHCPPLLVRDNRLHDNGQKNEQAKSILSNEVECLPEIVNDIGKPQQQGNARYSGDDQATNERYRSPIKRQPPERRFVMRKVLIVLVLEGICALVGAFCLFHLLNLRNCNTKSLDSKD
jgi:hypothetical protein